MRIFSLLTVLGGAAFAQVVPDFASAPFKPGVRFLGDLSDCQVVVLNGVSVSDTINVAGSMAVGGSLTAPGLNSVGSAFDSCGKSTPFGLQVGGNVNVASLDFGGRFDYGGTLSFISEIDLLGCGVGTSPSSLVTGMPSDNSFFAFSNALAAVTATGTFAGSTLTGSNNPVYEVFNVPGASITTGMTFSFSNIKASATVIINISGASVTFNNVQFPATHGGEKIFLNVYQATNVVMNNSAANFRATLFAPGSQFVDNTTGNFYIDGQLVVNSVASSVLNVGSFLGNDSPDNTQFILCPANVLGSVAASDCARQFTGASGQLVFQDTVNNVQYTTYTNLLATTVQFQTLNSNPLGQLVITGSVNNPVVSQGSPITASSLSFSFVFTAHGPRVAGDAPPYPPGFVHANWMYYDFQSGAISGQNIQVAMPNAGTKLLSIGDDADGVLNDGYSLTLPFAFTLPNQNSFIKFARLQIKLSSTCTTTFPLANFDLTNLLDNDPYGAYFSPRYSKAPMQAIYFAVSSGVIYGLNPLSANNYNVPANTVIRMKGKLSPILGTGVSSTLDFDWWFTQNLLNSLGVMTAPQTDASNLYGDWRGFTIVAGSMEDKTNAAFFTVTNSPSGAAAIIGSGASLLSPRYSFYFPARYAQSTTIKDVVFTIGIKPN